MQKKIEKEGWSGMGREKIGRELRINRAKEKERLIQREKKGEI